MAKQSPEERERQRRLREATTAKREQERRTLDAKYWRPDGTMIDQTEYASTLFGVLWAVSIEQLTPVIPRRAGILGLVEFIGDSALDDERKRRAENIKRTADAAYVAPRTVQRWVAAAINPTAKETRGTSAAGRRRIWETLRGAAREAALAEIRHNIRAQGLGADLVAVILISKDRRVREFEDIGADGYLCAELVTPAMQMQSYDTAAAEWFKLAMEDYKMPEITKIVGSDDVPDSGQRARMIERALTERHDERGRQQALERMHRTEENGIGDIGNMLLTLYIGYGDPNDEEPERRPYVAKAIDENL